MPKYLSPEGLEKLKRELEYLKTDKTREIAERLRHAISFGDLRENAAYEEAKEAQSFLHGKILELEEIIREARLLDRNKSGNIQIGSLVSVEVEGKTEEIQICEPEESDVLKGKISGQSPLGKALLGKKKGDKVKIETPDGNVEYKIAAVE